jgi:acyl carrier protein
MQETEPVIREILVAINNRLNDADANADLYADFGLASVHAITLLTDLEERFRIHIRDEDFIEARSISQLTLMIDALLLEQSGNA